MCVIDMARTSINVFGNCLGTCVMARLEGSFRSHEWREEEIERRRLAAAEKQQRQLREDGLSEMSIQEENNQNMEVIVHDEKNNGSVKSLDIHHLQKHS